MSSMETGEELLWRDDANEAIREGIADVDAGRTRPADDVIAELCQRYLPVDDDASQ
jgi:predicted transcriptional regulator